MAEKIEFVRNYSDLSTKQGFQFEFHCDRCGTAYRSQFRTSATGAVSDVLDAVSGVFGGLFHTAADLTNHAHSATWKRSHDEAFITATREIQPEFIQCPHCLAWVCRRSCWSSRGICKNCAPDLAVAASAAQAEVSVQEVRAAAAMAEDDKPLLRPETWKDTVQASCPHCEKPLTKDAKFCPHCGEKLKIAAYCSGCGGKLTPNAKFCPECGVKAQ